MTRGIAAIDELMERASEALVEAEYFDSERLCARALRQARAANDFERMARICLPLQEARRQIRQLAETSGVCRELHANLARTISREPGCFLLQPPLLGVDAGAFRDSMRNRKVPAFVLTREPMTRAGKWPIVAVAESSSLRGSATGMRSVRAQVDPPPGVVFTGQGLTRDLPPIAARESKSGPPSKPRRSQAARDDRAQAAPSLQWFTAAGESLGDAAIAVVDRSLHPAFQADDLIDFLNAIPEHEKLHQALAAACRAADRAGPPKEPRQIADANPWSF